MPEEVEIETHELQEKIEEAHHHGSEHKPGPGWIRYISLSTAAFAAFAAVGALQSGALVNEAMLSQLKASDTWNEYQSARQKTHIYGLAANTFLDSGIAPAPPKPKSTAKPSDAEKPASEKPAAEKPATEKPTSDLKKTAVPKAPAARLRDYLDTIDRETVKAAELSEKAKHLEETGERTMGAHERFAYSVALLQVAIALGAVAALTRVKPVWYVSFVAGLVGVVFFVLGFTAPR